MHSFSYMMNFFPDEFTRLCRWRFAAFRVLLRSFNCVFLRHFSPLAMEVTLRLRTNYFHTQHSYSQSRARRHRVDSVSCLGKSLAYGFLTNQLCGSINCFGKSAPDSLHSFFHIK